MKKHRTTTGLNTAPITFALRFPNRAMYEAVRRSAEANRLSMNSLILNIIEDFVSASASSHDTESKS